MSEPVLATYEELSVSNQQLQAQVAKMKADLEAPADAPPVAAKPVLNLTLPPQPPLTTIQKSTLNRKALIDLAERASATFAQAFLAVEIADQNGVSQIEGLKIAVVAGGLAVAKFAYTKVNLYLAKNQGV